MILYGCVKLAFTGLLDLHRQPNSLWSQYTLVYFQTGNLLSLVSVCVFVRLCAG